MALWLRSNWYCTTQESINSYNFINSGDLRSFVGRLFWWCKMPCSGRKCEYRIWAWTASCAAFSPFACCQGTESFGGIPVLQEKYLRNLLGWPGTTHFHPSEAVAERRECTGTGRSKTDAGRVLSTQSGHPAFHPEIGHSMSMIHRGNLYYKEVLP